jgi:hypothetical protein
MRTGVPFLLIVLTAAACDKPTAVGPTPPPPTVSSPSNPPGSSVAVYLATFSASPSCASAIPGAARERTYTATLWSDGRIDWTAQTLHPPPGHRPISSGTLSEGTFSFFIDVDRDPQSDDFHGLWEDMGSGTVLTIAGKGRGQVLDGEITGVLDGLFAFYEPVPDPNVRWIGHYCQAVDHGFRFVRQ